MPAKTLSEVRFGRIAPCIGVRDVGVATAFYSGVLGFQKVFENGDPVGFVVLKRDDAELHVSLQRTHKASVRNVAHLFVDDVQAVYSACVHNGVRIIKELTHKEYGQDAFVLADPDGNRIDIGQRS